jgi:hypothetical protein
MVKKCVSDQSHPPRLFPLATMYMWRTPELFRSIENGGFKHRTRPCNAYHLFGERDVRVWHKADIETALSNVRFRG